MTGLESYLEREDFDADVAPADLSRERALERAAEEAYYHAVLSDPTHHGTNHSAKVRTVAHVCKSDLWPQFGADDFAEVDDAVDELLSERSGR